MIFGIKRASFYSTLDENMGPPCNGAFRPSIFDNISDIERWAIELNNLDDLKSFCKKHGPIVLDENNNILIYDDYIE